jgi:molecular chaperone DnaJ
MADKDHYKVLGVSKTASQDEIKKAYRKLAKDLHPDKNAGDKKIEDRFKEVSAAYDTLGDAKRRAEYDEMQRLGATGFRPGPGGAGGGFPGGFQGNFDAGQFGDINDLLGGLFGGGGRRGPRRGGDYETSVSISFEDSMRGVTLPLRLDAGTTQARIPAGVKNGQRIRLKGKGAQGEPGAPAGDLFITVTVAAHAVFERDGNNLMVTVPVKFEEAVNGADIEVPVFDGNPVTIRIPAGTKSGAKFRARGKGVHSSSGTSGDLIVTVDIAVPKDLNTKAKKALEELAKETADFDPRAELMRKAGGYATRGSK